MVELLVVAGTVGGVVLVRRQACNDGQVVPPLLWAAVRSPLAQSRNVPAALLEYL